LYKQTDTTYTRKRLFSLLEKLQSDTGKAVTLYFPAGLNSGDFKKIDEILSGTESIPDSMKNEILKSGSGAVLFWGSDNKYLVIPPFPVEQKVMLPGYQTDALMEVLKNNYKVAVVLIRMGAYAVGLFNGEQLLASKVGTGLVHSRHKKGGSSQHRYERHREKQIEYFFNRVCQNVREKFEDNIKSIEILYFGGERKTVNLFQEYCDFLKPLDSRISPKLLNIREPKQNTLVSAIYQVYSSRVIQLTEDSDLY